MFLTMAADLGLKGLHAFISEWHCPGELSTVTVRGNTTAPSGHASRDPELRILRPVRGAAVQRNADLPRARVDHLPLDYHSA